MYPFENSLETIGQHLKTKILKSRMLSCVTAAALACSLAATPGRAHEGWDWTGLIYFWGAGLGGETTTGQDVDVSFSEILENLDIGLMGSIEARNDRWAIFGDAIYLNISDDDNAAVGAGIPVSVDADIKGFVFTAGVGYDLARKGTDRFNGFAGLRYLDLDATVNLETSGGSRRLNGDFDSWDGIVGLRGQYTLSPNWDLIYYGDIGAGDSDLTWQAALTFDRKFDNWTLSFGYRHLEWQDLGGSATLTDLDFSGPFAGAKFRF